MGKPSAPPSPNYGQIAQQQGAANVDAARQSAFLSNPNIITPYGRQDVTWGPLQLGSPTTTTTTSPVTTTPPPPPPPPPAPAPITTTPPVAARPITFFTKSGQSRTLNLTPDQLSGSAPPELQQMLMSGEGWMPVDPKTGTALNPAGMQNGGMTWSGPAGTSSLYNYLFPDVPLSPKTPAITSKLNQEAVDPETGQPTGTTTTGTTGTTTTSGGVQSIQPTITQTLNPTAQATLEQSQLAQLGLATTANKEQGVIGNLLATPYTPAGTIQQNIPSPGAVNLNTPTAAGQVYGAGNVYANPATTPNLFGYGSAQGVNGAPNLQQNINTAGIASMPVNAGMTGQQAIMSRLQPQLDLQRQQLHTQLTNQGLVAGDEAYNNAMRIMGQQQNDALSQATLQGLNLDFAANQQGFGQAATQSQFTNQAALSQFGAGLQGQQFGNQAIAQNQQTALAQQQADNQARAQGFANAQQLQQAQNAAYQQNYQNQLTQQQAYNQALQQAFGQNVQGAQFANAAQQQANQQALATRDLPLNEIAALLSGSQVTNPQFQAYQGQTIAPTPVMQGAQAQGAWDQNMYAQQVSQRNALMGGLFQLGGGLFGAAGASKGFGNLFGLGG